MDKRIDDLINSIPDWFRKISDIKRRIGEIESEMMACLQIFGFIPEQYLKKEVKRARKRFKELDLEKKKLENELKEMEQ